jgi:hypothetical protein
VDWKRKIKERGEACILLFSGHGMFACRRLDIVVVVVFITGSCCLGAAAAAVTPELLNSIFPLP